MRLNFVGTATWLQRVMCGRSTLERSMSVTRSFGLTAALLIASAASGQSPNTGTSNLELTMRLLPERAATPDAVMRTIELPPAASPVAVENSQHGLDRANEVRALRDERSNGRETAADARDTAADARERGREIAEQVRENRGETGTDQGAPGPSERPRPEPPSGPNSPAS